MARLLPPSLAMWFGRHAPRTSTSFTFRFYFQVAPVFLLVFTVVADKKIELQDIEDDNLKSEKEKDIDNSEPRSQSSGSGTAPGLLPLEFFKNGLIRYFDTPTQAPQQPRFVHQYAVTEPPERPPPVSPKPQYGPPPAQQAMVGYLSNVPMQIYLVPQYYSETSEQAASHQPAVQYSAPAPRVPAYHVPESVQAHANYVEVPTYVTPTGKTYVQQYQPPVAYVTYSQPTIAPVQSTVGPVVYQMPVVQYPTALVAPPVISKGYYQQYTETNAVDDVQDEAESPKQYVTQTEVPYTKPTAPEYPRYYNSRAPIREEYRHTSISELPPPNPLLLKGPPPHLAHLPKALPFFSRPLTRPVYASGGNFISSAYTPKTSETYGTPFKRRPSSLLDSYVPSSVQIDYLKKGYAKDPLAAYEALSTGRHFSHTPIIPRQYERGFLPNQMYHTAGGGITYGHYKRTPKEEKVSKK